MTSQTPQGLQIIPGKVTGFGQAGIKSGSRMAFGKNETVTIFPEGIAGIVTHLVEIKNGQNIDGRKAPPRMTRLGGIKHFENFNSKAPSRLLKLSDCLFF
jgi:hypothetical protein